MTKTQKDADERWTEGGTCEELFIESEAIVDEGAVPHKSGLAVMVNEVVGYEP